MFARNGLSFAHRIIIYAHVIGLSVQRQAQGSVHVGCLDEDDLSSRCYAVHDQASKTHKTANEECRKQHNGQLATIHNSSIQTRLLDLLNNSNIQPATNYWIGAQFELLDKWTWLDGTPYSAVQHQEFRNAAITSGYTTIGLDVRGNNGSWQIKSMPFSGVRNLKTRALCELKDSSEEKRYFSVAARSWFGGRNNCLADAADLAVLADNDSMQRANAFAGENVDYFIGLATVRLMWINSTVTGAGIRIAANYTNWKVGAPRNEDELCVVLYSQSGVWDVTECNVSKPFICEYTATETAITTYKHPSSVSATEEPNNSGNTQPAVLLAVIVLSSVLLMIIAVAAILLCCMRRRKPNYESPERYTGLAGRNISGSTLGSNSASIGYAAVFQPGQSDSPDVCGGRSAAAAAATAYIDDGPQYAQVNKISKNAPATQTAAAEEYANLPQPQATSPLTISAVETAVVPANVVESSGAEYANV